MNSAGRVCYRVGKYRLDYHSGRVQPFTVWLGDKVIYFAKDQDEALAAISRDQGSWGTRTRIREVNV